MTARERINKLKIAVDGAGPVPVYAPALEEFVDILEMQQGAIERMAVLLSAVHGNASSPLGASFNPRLNIEIQKFVGDVTGCICGSKTSIGGGVRMDVVCPACDGDYRG